MYIVMVKIKYEYAHRLINHQGNCRNIHGHSGEARIELAADNLNNNGFVIDFSEIKSAVKKWINENFDKLNVNAIFNAGSSIDIMAGMKKVCPNWLSNIGLEWLFRLVHEPRRLFWRYIFGNPRFIYYIFCKRNE